MLLTQPLGWNAVSAPPAAGYRYVELYVTANNGSALTAVVRLELYESPRGPNVAGGQTYSASSTYTTYTPGKAFNNTINDGATGGTQDFWLGTTGANEWLRVDFGAGNEKTITDFAMLTRRQGAGVAMSPKEFRLRGSNDLVTWVDIGAPVNQVMGVSDLYRSFSTPVADPYGAHDYWSVYIYAGHDSTPTLGEIEFRATLGSADQATGGTAFSSSNYPGELPVYFFDDNLLTYSSGSLNCYSLQVWYQFPSAVSVRQIQLTARHVAPADAGPLHFLVMYSDDAIDWTTAWIETLEPAWALSEARTYDSPDYL